VPGICEDEQVDLCLDCHRKVVAHRSGKISDGGG
jgi:hypothetical protein